MQEGGIPLFPLYIQHLKDRSGQMVMVPEKWVLMMETAHQNIKNNNSFHILERICTLYVVCVRIRRGHLVSLCSLQSRGADQ